MYVGYTNESTVVSMTNIKVRLPDKMMGMFLAYAQDQYGLNPHMLMGLAAKESFGTAVDPSNDNSYFIVDDENDLFDCFNTDGLCTDGNRDGLFQVETPSMGTDISCIPHRFYTGSKNVPKKDRVPIYVTDNELLGDESALRELHDWMVLNPYRAVVMTSLDFHFRHNVFLMMRKQGLRPAYDSRTDREGKDALEFATAMYTYNRGLFGNMDLTSVFLLYLQCTPDLDPITDCGLDGYGGHGGDINNVCLILDHSNEVYDFEISLQNVTYFIDTLEETYPYDHVNGDFDSIPWDEITIKAQEAYDLIYEHRKSINPNSNGISFRYDWRLLLSVIRAYLPVKENLGGPTMEYIYIFILQKYC